MKTFLVLLITVLLATKSARSAEPVDYAKQIKPVLQARCYACHGVLKQEGQLRLDTAAQALKGGENGAAFKPKDVAGSLLLKRITAAEESERMPPEGEPLKPAEIAAIKAWIEQGAVAPADEKPEADPREHWAFKAPVRPAVPTVKETGWVKTPIDAFVLAELERRGLKHQPAADKRLWLRRVSLDLIGLPPTLEEQDSFLKDDSAEAFDKVVTRLLASPHYGERWGRHWMDIWRYSDWWGLGAEVRNSQKHIWHWRDWIIESLNADKGYDQMLREMLAADELYPNDLDRLRGSGFLARQYFKFNRTSWLDETVEHTSKAMLGLTFNCSKCHDHKYDPIAQLDYYRLRAIFEPYQVRTDLVPGSTDFEKDGLPRAFDCNLDAVTHLHLRGDDRNPDKSRVIDPGLPAFLSVGNFEVQQVKLPAEAYLPGLRSFIVKDQLEAAQQRIEAAKQTVATAKLQLAAAEAAAAKKPLPPAESTTPVDTQKFVARDEFKAANPDLWQMGDGQWSYTNGKLVQSQAGAVRRALRLKTEAPQDFECRFQFVPTGGDMWKSVGLNFDVNDKNEALAYLSAYAGGSKSQVSYKAGDSYVYPPNGAQARDVKLGEQQDVIVRARGTLINVTINGQHSIAYRLPIERQRGSMELITFDAKAEFSLFELRALPATTMLVDAAASTPAAPEKTPLSPEQAQTALRIAEKALLTAEAQPASIQARAEADKVRASGSDARVAAQAAAKAERIVAAAKADEDFARAELEALKATPEKKAEAEKKLAAARTAAEAARKAVDMPAETYTSLVGSLKTLESNLENEASRSKPFPQTSTGRRSAFAKWITDPKNPLPARVAVNHLWSRHFGKPLVPTVFDFGRKGTPPSHPELLDWLAVELMESAQASGQTAQPAWSMKHIHRLIVLSNTYRMTSSIADAASENLTVDADNKYVWRTNPVRMEAQIVRDSLLHLAGELDETIGGPSLPVNDEATRRRSLYFVHSHNEHQKFLSVFDDASVLECYRRAESIVPQQALALENSKLAMQMAEKIAAKLSTPNTTISSEEFARRAFVAVLGSEPTREELQVSMEALEQFTQLGQQRKRPNAQANAQVELVRALLNHNDFVTVR